MNISELVVICAGISIIVSLIVCEGYNRYGYRANDYDRGISKRDSKRLDII